MNKKMVLNGEDWQVSGWYSNQWRAKTSMELDMNILPVIPPIQATVPGSVQADLQAAGLLPDVNVGLKSLEAEWVNNREWIFEKQFAVTEDWLLDNCDLVFEGLDYSGKIFLNGLEIADFEGMFKPVTIDVTDKIRLQADGVNELQIVFYQSPEVDGQIGYSHMINKLKSRFNYAWDWCPRIVPVGIWKDVYLTTYRKVKLLDFYPETELSSDLNEGRINCASTVSVKQKGSYRFEYQVFHSNGTKICSQTVHHELKPGKNEIAASIQLGSVDPWWPANYGNQCLYEVHINIQDIQGISCTKAKKTVGFRTIEWIQNTQSSSDSMPYTLLVNGRRIFIKGVNWVPITPFYGSILPGDYENYLGRFKHMNVNLLRVWGGAIVEKEAFYEYCDQNGLMIWQEFLQSSSGLTNEPPNNPEFLKELEAVSKFAILEKRSHPSLVIWCGGNELMWDGFVPVNEHHQNIKMLKRLVNKLDPNRHFFPSSPSGPKFQASEEDFGRGLHHDVHGPWNYLGSPSHYEFFNSDDALFRSETGTPGTSRAGLIRKMSDQWPVWPPTDKNPFWTHRGAWWIQWQQLSEMYGDWQEDEDELETYCQASRYLQAESLRYSVEATRRKKPQSSGFIVWMGNEPFANNANTSLLEYDGLPKPAYYPVRSAFSKIHVSASYNKLSYKVGETFTCNLYLHYEEGMCVDAHAITQAELKVSLINSFGKLMKQDLIEILPENSLSFKIGQFQWEVADCPHKLFFLKVELMKNTKTLVTNDYLFFVESRFPLQPLRLLPKAEVRLSYDQEQESIFVTNISTILAVGVFAHEQDSDRFLHFHSNYCTILPGEKICLIKSKDESLLKTITIEGFNLFKNDGLIN